AGIELLQALQSVVQGFEIERGFFHCQGSRIQGEVRVTPAALHSLAATSMSHENAPHNLCSDSEELRSAPQGWFRKSRQLDVSLVDERGRLQGDPASLPAQVARCETSQLIIDQRNQLGRGPAALDVRDKLTSLHKSTSEAFYRFYVKI